MVPAAGVGRPPISGASVQRWSGIASGPAAASQLPARNRSTSESMLPISTTRPAKKRRRVSLRPASTQAWTSAKERVSAGTRSASGSRSSPPAAGICAPALRAISAPKPRLPSGEAEQRPSRHPIRIGRQVGGPDVVRVAAEREDIDRGRVERPVRVLHGGQHEPALVAAAPQDLEQGPVVAAQHRFGRGGEDQVEPDDHGPGIQRRLDDGGELGRPQGAWQVGEGRPEMALLVQCHHHDLARPALGRRGEPGLQQPCQVLEAAIEPGIQRALGQGEPEQCRQQQDQQAEAGTQ